MGDAESVQQVREMPGEQGVLAAEVAVQGGQ